MTLSYYEYDRQYAAQRVEEIFKIHQYEYCLSDLTIYELAALAQFNIISNLGWDDERFEQAKQSYKSLVKAQTNNPQAQFKELEDLKLSERFNATQTFESKITGLLNNGRGIPSLFKGFFNINYDHDCASVKVKIIDELVDVWVEKWQLDHNNKAALMNNLEKRALSKFTSVQALKDYFEQASTTTEAPVALAESLWDWLSSLPNLEMWKRATARSLVFKRGDTLKKVDAAIQKKDGFITNEDIKGDIHSNGGQIIKFSQDFIKVVEEYKNKKNVDHGKDGEDEGWLNSPRFQNSDARAYMNQLLNSTMVPQEVSSTKLESLSEALTGLKLYRRGGLSYYLLDIYAGTVGIKLDPELQGCLTILRSLDKAPLSILGHGVTAGNIAYTGHMIKDGLEEGFKLTAPVTKIAIDNLAFSVPAASLVSLLVTSAKAIYNLSYISAGSRDLADEKKYGGMKQAAFYDKLEELLVDHTHIVYQDIGKAALNVAGELGGPAGKAVTSAIGSITDLILQYVRMKASMLELDDINATLSKSKYDNLENLYQQVAKSKFMTSHLTREKGLIALWNTMNYSHFSQMKAKGTLGGASERSVNMLFSTVAAATVHMDNCPLQLYRQKTPIHYLPPSALMAHAVDLKKMSLGDKAFYWGSDMVHEMKHKIDTAQLGTPKN